MFCSFHSSYKLTFNIISIDVKITHQPLLKTQKGVVKHTTPFYYLHTVIRIMVIFIAIM